MRVAKFLKFGVKYYAYPSTLDPSKNHFSP